MKTRLPSRKNLLELIRSTGRKELTTKEIAGHFNLSTEHLEELDELLEELQKSGDIARLQNGKWFDPSEKNMLVGHLDSNPRGFGFVIPASPALDEDVYIPESRLSGAMDGDLVLVKYKAPRKNRKDSGPAGRIVNVLKRAHTTLVGTFQPARSGGAGTVLPDNPSLETHVLVPGGGKQAGEGEKVLVEITEWPAPDKGRKRALGRIIRTLGPENTPEVDELSVIHQFNLPEEFPESVIEKAGEIPFEPGSEDIKNREDLSDIPTVAVDPENAKDCDDALSMFYDKNTGQKVVIVHIADVSRRVRPGCRVDLEARKRGLSVYLVRSFIPMIPREATQRKLSLAAGKKRLAKTVELRFNRDNRLVSSRIFRSVAELDRQMTYDEVQEILATDDKSKHRMPREIIKLIRDLDSLAGKLRESRQKLGSVDLDVPEYEVKTGSDGKISAVSQIERDRSHSLVEEFMLQANITVAAFLNNRNLPAIYRIHEEPEEEDLEAFSDFIYTILNRRIDPFERKEIQNLLLEVHGTNFSESVNMELLKCMKRARYSTGCAPHFALHFPVYCHFTSPVRRYPDLAVHQILDDYLDGRMKKGEVVSYWRSRLASVARHCTAAEEEADKAEREIIKIKLLRFMEEKGISKGQVFDGIITGVKEFGFFAQLQQFSVEGMVKVSDLEDDYYRHHPEQRALIGVRRGRVFRLGQQVKLKVEHIDTAKRRLELKLAR